MTFEHCFSSFISPAYPAKTSYCMGLCRSKMNDRKSVFYVLYYRMAAKAAKVEKSVRYLRTTEVASNWRS